jgi:hypothetical protein
MESSYRNKNISILEKNHPHLPSLPGEGETGDEIEVIDSKQGGPVPVLHIGERKISIHSKFDPVKEAERFMGEINTGKHNLFLVFGFGFGFHLEALLERIDLDSRVMVIEKNVSLFSKAVSRRDLTRLFGDTRLMLLLDPGEDDISGILKGKSSRSVSFITHRGSHQAYPEYYANMLEISRSYLSTKEVNIATLAKFEKIWCSNIARNINSFCLSPGVNQFYEKFSGIPAVVVGAGPSLPESYSFLRENRERMIIVAVDTSYRMLMKNGIEPHFCLSVDPQVINARYFEGCGESSTILVYEPSVHPSVLRFFQGRTISAGIPFDIMKWIEKSTGSKGEITHGGSVSTNACDFAGRLGASPVYLVGQDLGFTGGLAHARGSYMEEQVHLKTTRINNPEMHNRSQLYALPRINVKGIRSKSVHTNQKMMIFLSWFEKRSRRELVNLTGDGAFINGVRHMELGDVVCRDHEVPLSVLIDEIYSGALKDVPDAAGSGEELCGRVENMIRGIEELLPHLEKGINFSENLVEIMNGKKRDGNKINYILKKLADVDAAVESGKNVKDMISLTIQRVIHTINEGYELEAGEGNVPEDEQVARRSHYLYRGLMEGALFNKKILGKLKTKLTMDSSWF